MAGAPTLFLDKPWQGASFSPPTPIDIATIEAAIVAQLQSFLSAALGGQMIEVTHFPDKASAYRQVHRIGTALVIYSGSDYGKIEDIGHVAQERDLHFQVTAVMRDLGWAYGGPPSGPSPGAYQVIELIRMALLGFQPNTGCTPMRGVRDRFVERDHQGGVWYYEHEFATRTVVIENFVIPTFPLFTHGTALEEGGQTQIQVQIGFYQFGGPQFQTDEIVLSQQNLSAVIVKSQNLQITYVPGVDYSLDNVNGIITRISTGAISASATVAVSYAYGDVVTVLASGGTAPFAPNN